MDARFGTPATALQQGQSGNANHAPFSHSLNFLPNAKTRHPFIFK
jgi:hypothetical protein